MLGFLVAGSDPSWRFSVWNLLLGIISLCLHWYGPGTILQLRLTAQKRGRMDLLCYLLHLSLTSDLYRGKPASIASQDPEQ